MKIVYDCTLRRPGCVIIQAGMGGDVPDFASRFPSESWLVAPTKDMRTYKVTEDQLKKLVEMTEKAHGLTQ